MSTAGVLARGRLNHDCGSVTKRMPLEEAGVRVSFTIISGSATLSTPSIITGIDGSASVNVTLGTAVGPVIIDATVPGVAPVRFNLTVTAPVGGGGDVSAAQPRIAAGGVVGVGGSVPAVAQLSPNGLFSIYGSGFAKDGTLRQVGADDLSGGRLPDRLDNLCVEVGGQRGRVLLITPGQLNVQTPSNLAPGTQPVQIVSNCGQTPEVRSNIEMITVQSASPEFLYFMRNGNGVNPIAAVNAVTGSYIGPVNTLPGVALDPAAPGDVITLYATGFGATNPAFAAGEFSSGIARTIGTVAVFLGNTEFSAEAILYAGVTPGSPGLYQLNIRVPESSPDGNLPMVIRVGNISSPPGAFIAVKRP